jgi:cytochrome c oxidase cbb3-type subunit 3
MTPARRIALVAIALLLAGCQKADGIAFAGAAKTELQLADKHEAGRKIYNFRCYYCHGYAGDARTLASTYLSPRPRDFSTEDSKSLDQAAIALAVRDGKPGTAMKAFNAVLSPSDIALVASFVREEFIVRRASNTRYHTIENGWPDHRQRYALAFPFATGEIALDGPWEALTPEQRQGKRLFLSACVSCHDRGRVGENGKPWELVGSSYPPGNNGDSFAVHDIPPTLPGLGASARRGERLYQDNCAYCHAADGSGRNWIGAFLEPHPPDFTDPAQGARLVKHRLVAAIRDGVPGSSMPAWKQVLQPAEMEAIALYMMHAFSPNTGSMTGARNGQVR